MPNKHPISRFPKLGKLSIAILENLVESVLGEKTLDELKSPNDERELQDSLIKTLVQTEKRFIAEYTDKAISEAIINLPLANLPSVMQAVRCFYSRPTDNSLEQILSEQLLKDFTTIPSEQVQSGVSAYIKILQEELVSLTSAIREKLSTLAVMDTQDNTARIADSLDHILKFLGAENKVTELIGQQRFEGLRIRLMQRKNPKILRDAVYEGEALYNEGKLPADFKEIIYGARKAFDEIRVRHGEITTYLRYGDLSLCKEALDKISKQLCNGEMYFLDPIIGDYVPIYKILQVANKRYLDLSAITAQHEIEKVNIILTKNPMFAAEELRRALQQAPFFENDRKMLEDKLATIIDLCERVGGFVEQELTLQEKEIARLAVVNDWTPRRIADELHISTSIVDIQITRICQKLQTYFGLEFANLTTLTTWLGGYWH